MIPRVHYELVECKTLLHRIDVGYLPFRWDINPYRGCVHSCVYCFARYSHEYLGLNAGADFEQHVRVKINAAQVLRRELARPRWQRELAANRGRAPFRLAALFSDNPQSKASELASEYDLPLVLRDIGAFYRARGKPRRDLALRAEFDAATVRALSPFEARGAAYGGYMSIVTEPLLEAWPGRIVNVHPADLTIRDGTKRRYVGDHAVRDAIRAGESAIRSTTHVVRREVRSRRTTITGRCP